MIEPLNIKTLSEWEELEAFDDTVLGEYQGKNYLGEPALHYVLRTPGEARYFDDAGNAYAAYNSIVGA
jgi:hypothetical protein